MEDYGFKFKIGDRVTMAECAIEAAAANAQLKPDAYARYTTPLLIVRGRLLEECYGGIQRHYDCRAIHRGQRTVGDVDVAFSAPIGSNGLFRLSEPELQLLAVATDAPK